jgi:hypothetical protein
MCLSVFIVSLHNLFVSKFFIAKSLKESVIIIMCYSAVMPDTSHMGIC